MDEVVALNPAYVSSVKLKEGDKNVINELWNRIKMIRSKL